MESDEIRARISEARRACAEAKQPADDQAAGENIARLSAALAKLAEATEWILGERDAINDRLRRTPRARPKDDAPAATAAAAGSAPETPESTPSPAKDA